jgi:hypothetical protein
MAPQSKEGSRTQKNKPTNGTKTGPKHQQNSLHVILLLFEFTNNL